jgi:hypothetical protein
VEFRVNPWGKIFVDGAGRGVSPLGKPLLLSRKRHKIRIENPYFQIWEDSVDLKNRSAYIVYVKLKEKKLAGGQP